MTNILEEHRNSSVAPRPTVLTRWEKKSLRSQSRGENIGDIYPLS
jgi:hypothetical protein